MSGLPITGVGMVCSIGHRVELACAALRAGITRPTPLRSYSIMDASGDEEDEPILVHAIRDVTEGFYLTGLWTCIAESCLRDLLRNAAFDRRDSKFWQRTGFALVLPALDTDRYLLEEEIDPALLEEEVVGPLLALAGLQVEPQNLLTLSTNETGVAQAVEWGTALIERGDLERIVVLAADSLCDVLSIEWLAAQRRLKLPGNPVGAMPGEAGAAFVLESAEAAQARGARVCGWLRGCRSQQAASEPDDFRDLGKSLSALIEACLSGTRFEGRVIGNHNGENWRAAALALAVVKPRGPGHSIRRWIFPAESVGDVGVASGAVGVCVAAQAIERGYADIDDQLILSLSSDGGLGALWISSVEV